MNVRWPKKYEKFYHQVRCARRHILGGIMLAIDPGSTSPGFAIFHNGQLQISGTIKMPNKPIHMRLQVLYDKVNTILPEPPDVLAIEQIRGAQFSHEYLRWSVGVSIAASRSPILIEVPLNVWRAVSKAMPDYVKSDEKDAELIGQCLIMYLSEEANADT